MSTYARAGRRDREAFAINARSDFRLRRTRFEYLDGGVRQVWAQRHRRLVAGTPEGEIVIEQAPVVRILAMPPVLGAFTRVAQHSV